MDQGPDGGPTLLLRPWSEADAPGLRDAVDEDLDHLKPWLSWTLEEPATLERTRSRLREWEEQLRDGRGLRYALVTEHRPALILGGAGLNRRLGPDAYTVGYWLRPSATGRGFAGAAVAALVVHAFRGSLPTGPDPAVAGHAPERLLVRCDVANPRSAAFARALGFSQVRSYADTYPDGTPRPLLELRMTREDYRTRHAPTLRERARRVLVAGAASGA